MCACVCMITMNIFTYCIASQLYNSVEVSESLFYGRKEEESGSHVYHLPEITICVLLAFSQVPTWAPYYNVLYILPNVKIRCGGAGHLPKVQGCWQSQRGAKTQVPLCAFSWKWPVNEARIYHSMVCRAFCLVRFFENSEISLLL